MSTDPTASSISLFLRSLMGRVPQGKIPAVPVTIVLSCFVGILGGYGAVLFTFLIHTVGRWSVDPIWMASTENPVWLALLWTVPALGLLAVSWFTRTFAPEAQGHGVPEVITAMARDDGAASPRVSVVKIPAGGICIDTGEINLLKFVPVNVLRLLLIVGEPWFWLVRVKKPIFPAFFPHDTLWCF